TVLDDGDGRSRDMVIGQLHADHTVQKGFQLVRIAQSGGRRRGWCSVHGEHWSPSHRRHEHTDEQDNGEESNTHAPLKGWQTLKARHDTSLLFASIKGLHLFQEETDLHRFFLLLTGFQGWDHDIAEQEADNSGYHERARPEMD